MMNIKKFNDCLLRMKADMPKIMETLIIDEGLEATKHAEIAVTQQGRVETGRYRSGFHVGDAGSGSIGAPAKHNGGGCEIDIYNNVPYAGLLEYGSKTVQGTYALQQGVTMMRQAQSTRLRRKMENILKLYVAGGGIAGY